jgi:hypothetical protein
MAQPGADLKVGGKMITKAEIQKDLAQMMSLLLEVEKECPDSRIAQARELTSKVMREVDRLKVSGPLRKI